MVEACLASTEFMKTSPQIGRKVWAIPEGYIPDWGHGPKPELESHEAFCVLNTTEEEAHITLTIFYADRDPAGYPDSGRSAALLRRTPLRSMPGRCHGMPADVLHR